MKTINTTKKIDTEKMIDTIKKINVEISAYAKAMQHDTDGTNFNAMATHVDELLREQSRAMGLPEDEIARIEQESEAATNQQIADEVRQARAQLGWLGQWRLWQWLRHRGS